MNCKNCNTELVSESQYCYNCGGKVIKNRLTFKNLAQHLGETFFNYDNKLFMTIICLIKAPEKVIDSYVQGIRKRYINPISFFGISLTITGLSIFIIKKFFIEYLDMSNLYENAGSQVAMEEISSGALEYSSLIYSVAIPILAFISFLIFYKKPYNYTEHIVLYLYSLSLFSIVSVVLGQLVLFIAPNQYIAFGIAFYFLAFIYHCYLLKRIFKLSTRELILKTLLFLVLFFVLYIGFSILAFAVLMLSGSMNLQDFAPK